MLSQSTVTNLSAEDLKNRLYASVGLQGYTDSFLSFLDRNFSPYNFILGLNPYIRNPKYGRIGNIRNVDVFRYTQSCIINELCLDLKELDYEYRILDTYFSDRTLHKKEFMLKLFICDVTEECRRGDYQIMRYDASLEEWFFKPSTREKPTLCREARGVIMINGEPAGYVTGSEGVVKKEFYPFAYIAVRPMRLSKKIWRAFILFTKWIKNRHK